MSGQMPAAMSAGHTGWALDPARSHVAFVTIKSKDVAEAHSFADVAGSVDTDGKATVVLMLDSVETLVPIRNERMRELLFQTTNYGDAALTARIDPALLAGLRTGDIEAVAAEGQLLLHGQTQPVVLDMQVARVADDTLMVASRKPLLIEAADFGMADGVERLREIAGLDSISHAVPVSFVLTFVGIAD
ncbi:YceI family protein [Thiohalocapsa marina]|uniref:YceI family protein n=2 Tax=Thiohalocapsa marina TaxID=424902 RepID=A0A5M8FRQ0_9GAMM|nr:YceI family protein [Thiohalocapsa marina]